MNLKETAQDAAARAWRAFVPKDLPLLRLSDSEYDSFQAEHIESLDRYVEVLRPRLSDAEIATAIGRAFGSFTICWAFPSASP
jgi:hypothetical protein